MAVLVNKVCSYLAVTLNKDASPESEHLNNIHPTKYGNYIYVFPCLSQQSSLLTNLPSFTTQGTAPAAGWLWDALPAKGRPTSPRHQIPGAKPAENLSLQEMASNLEWPPTY